MKSLNDIATIIKNTSQLKAGMLLMFQNCTPIYQIVKFDGDIVYYRNIESSNLSTSYLSDNLVFIGYRYIGYDEIPVS